MTRVIVGLLALSVLLAAGFQAGGGHYAGSTPKRFSATLLRDGEHPDMAPVRDAPIVMKLVALRADGSIDPDFNWYRDGLRIDGLLDREDQPLARFDESGYQGHATWSRTEEGALLVDSAVLDGKITVHDGGYSEVVITRTVFGLAALLPALVAIVLAIVTRQVLFALFCGIWIGGWSLTGGPWSGFQEVVTELLPGALDSDRVKILIFS
ncbi:MAG: hypothetical protein KDB18_14340, partial [Salinibacterium sp.]|nr:hypothetical protein [Salinibacterium sp.]